MTTPAPGPDTSSEAEDVPDVLDVLAGPALRAQLRADQALVAAAAATLRHAATQDGYRGRRGQDRAYALASVLDMARMRWRDQDPAFRARLRTCSRVLIGTDAPAGPDPGRDPAAAAKSGARPSASGGSTPDGPSSGSRSVTA